MKEIVFLNGRFMPSNEAKISILEPAFLYGWALFESMRAYNNKIVYLDAHLKRLKDSCKLIAIRFPYSLPKLKEIIKRTIKINELKDAYVRLTLCKLEHGTGVLISAKKYTPYPQQKYKQGLCACVSSFRQNENSILARIKTNNYLFYKLAYQEAKNKNFAEAIILDNSGYIAEGSRSNIFLIKDNKLFTPALECGCLDGITRKAILDLAKKYKIESGEANLTLQDLYAAEEAFLTNSLMGVIPLVAVEGHKIGKSRVKKLSEFFMKKYNLLLKNGT